MKFLKGILILAVCMPLCSCATGPIGRTLDCTNLWRFNSCILFEKEKAKGGRGGVSYVGGKRVYPKPDNVPEILPHYRPARQEKPSRVFKHY